MIKYEYEKELFNFITINLREWWSYVIGKFNLNSTWWLLRNLIRPNLDLNPGIRPRSNPAIQIIDSLNNVNLSFYLCCLVRYLSCLSSHYLYIFISTYLSIYLCIYLYINLSIYLSTYLSIYLSIYLYMGDNIYHISAPRSDWLT